MMATANENGVTVRQIEEIAKATIGQSNNSRWLEYRKKILTSSFFGRPIRASINPKKDVIENLKRDIKTPTAIQYLPPIKWGIEHDQAAIVQYVKETEYIVKPTGLWLFPKGYLGASPDGLVFVSSTDPHPTAPSSSSSSSSNSSNTRNKMPFSTKVFRQNPAKSMSWATSVHRK